MIIWDVAAPQNRSVWCIADQDTLTSCWGWMWKVNKEHLQWLVVTTVLRAALLRLWVHRVSLPKSVLHGARVCEGATLLRGVLEMTFDYRFSLQQLSGKDWQGRKGQKMPVSWWYVSEITHRLEAQNSIMGKSSLVQWCTSDGTNDEQWWPVMCEALGFYSPVAQSLPETIFLPPALFPIPGGKIPNEDVIAVCWG